MVQMEQVDIESLTPINHRLDALTFDRIVCTVGWLHQPSRVPERKNKFFQPRLHRSSIHHSRSDINFIVEVQADSVGATFDGYPSNGVGFERDFSQYPTRHCKFMFLLPKKPETIKRKVFLQPSELGRQITSSEISI